MDMTTGHEVKDAISQAEPKISPKLLPASPQAERVISELLGGRHSTEGGSEHSTEKLHGLVQPCLGGKGENEVPNELM